MLFASCGLSIPAGTSIVIPIPDGNGGTVPITVTK